MYQHQEYIEKIVELLERCHDKQILDLIYKILFKKSQKA